MRNIWISLWLHHQNPRSPSWNRTTNISLEVRSYIHLTNRPLRDVRDSNPWPSPWQGEIVTNSTNIPFDRFPFLSCNVYIITSALQSSELFEPKIRIELTTYWLQISCSTSWATRAIVLSTGFEPVLPPWKGGDLTLSRTEHLRKVKDGCVDDYFYDWLY